MQYQRALKDSAQKAHKTIQAMQYQQALKDSAQKAHKTRAPDDLAIATIATTINSACLSYIGHGTERQSNFYGHCHINFLPKTTPEVFHCNRGPSLH
jgi:hypothetical protein